jgi:hypothetical protein
MKVRIDAAGRQVEIECGDANVTYEGVADKALAVWQSTDGAGSNAGPAYGFVSAERSRDRDPSSAMRRTPGVPE